MAGESLNVATPDSGGMCSPSVPPCNEEEDALLFVCGFLNGVQLSSPSSSNRTDAFSDISMVSSPSVIQWS